jgi:phosphoglycerate kinase
MNKQTIRDIDLKGKRVLVRVDFNVPVEDGQITDDTRIRAAVPTIQAILEQNPKSVVLMSHFGRPKGGPDPKYSLAPVAPALATLLGRDVQFAPDAVGDAADAAIGKLPEGGVILLENTRFHAGEEKNDQTLSEQMAKHGDVFVNDAFGSAHRAHSSTVGVTKYLPSVSGLLMEKELNYLSTALENPQRPFVAILGGAKVSDKIGVIEALLDKVDILLIGGGMANTFFKAKGYELGNSLVEDGSLDVARSLMEKGGDKLVLPVDVVIGDKMEEGAQTKTIDVSAGVPQGWAIYDVGPKTIELFGQKLQDAKTVVWNGPMIVIVPPCVSAARRCATALVPLA